ncbi:MAG TPA: P-II family nitrogen regulator [Firmicutes bacterium]|jgi:anthranilate phosphoribosyltransferase|nr:P-II family nitrogen regulator [Bacillota bacterium]
MNPVATHELIVTIVSRGYSDVVMDAARAAGATGGTVVHARSIGHKEAERFLGVTIEPEKEIVLITVSSAKKQAIMKAIATQTSAQTESKAFLMALPINGVIGTSAAT